MDDPNLDIAINADSSGAVAAFDGLDNAVSGFGQKMGELGETFTKPLEHVGVDIFGKKLLSLIGISSDARPIVGLLRTGIESLGDAFGFATGAVGLTVMGLTAAAAIIYKVVEANNKNIESLEKVTAEGQKQYSSTVDLTSSLEDYKTKVINLSPALETLAASTKKVNEENRFSLLQAEGKQLETITNEIRAKKELIEVNKERIENLKNTSIMTMDELRDSSLLEADVKKLTDANKTLTIEIDKETQARDLLIANIHSQARGYKGLDDEISKHGKAIEESSKKEEDAAKVSAAAFKKNEDYKRGLQRESMTFTKQIMESKYNIEIASLYGVGMVHAVQAKLVQDAWGNAYLQMAKGAGDSFARMIVDGDSFSKDMGKVFKDVLRSFISMIAEMEIRWAAAAFLRYIGMNPFASQAVSTMPVGQHALGYEGTVSVPTLFVAGDGGAPEHVKITSQSQAGVDAIGGGKGSGGGNTYIIGPFNAYGVNDPETFGRQAMQYILQQTRGRGQILPTGPSIF
jgi:hypothetical protein